MVSICEFMNKIGCTKWPEHWGIFFEEVCSDFEKNGCKFLNPNYYDNLHIKYGILNEFLDAFKLAAFEISKSKELSLFLHLLCRAMEDRERIMEDVYAYSLPQVPKGIDPISVNMLCGIAIYSQMDYCYNNMLSRNIPKHMITETMNKCEGGVRSYFQRNNGEYGYSLFDWYQLAVDGKLYNINRLEIEVKSSFYFEVRVYGNGKGDYIALADGLDVHRSGHILGTKHFEDTDGSWYASVTEENGYICGYPYGEDSLVKREKIKFKKDEWTELLRKGDPVINLHIPPRGKLTPGLVDETIEDTKEFLKKYYPDYDYKAFVCCSWILDTQNEKLLGKEANISKFGKRFNRFTVKDEGNAVFSFVYRLNNPAIEELPEDTRLHREFKKHFLSGKAIYNVGGYFFDKSKK